MITNPGCTDCTLHRGKSIAALKQWVPTLFGLTHRRRHYNDAMETPTSDIIVNTFGLDQTGVDEILGRLAPPHCDRVTSTANADGVVTVRVGSRTVATTCSQDQLNQSATEVERLLGPIAYGRDSQTIQASLVAILTDREKTIATAESCTGGWVGKRITDVPGASAVYVGGWIVYANAMKTMQLGVPTEMIQQHGAVSEPVARAMAHGAIQHSGANLSVAVTGIAGPDGGGPHKPVGTVWIGLGFKDDTTAGPAATDAWLCQLSGDRQSIRRQGTTHAVALLRFAALGHRIDEMPLARRG